MATERVSRRLTDLGRVVLVVSIVASIGARLVGLDEIVVAGVVAIMTILVAFAVVTRWKPAVDVERTVHPRRLEAGSVCTVSLAITNRAARTSLVLTLADRLDGAELGALRLAPLAAGSTRSARYEFVAEQRGITQVGPLLAESTDPFGLVRATASHPGATDVIVLPRIHRLDGMPVVIGEEPEVGEHRRRILVNANDEFATLRDYVPGDDVRWVHWPSTARTGSPVVRHHEHPWQRRTTVLLDDRAAHHDDESFERAVSAAASVIVASHRRDELVRLVTTSGRDTGYVDDDPSFDHILDQLAAIAPAASGSLTGAIRQLTARGVGGQMVSCVADIADDEVAALSGAAVGVQRPIVVACGRPLDLDRASVVVVRFAEPDSLDASWSAATSRLVGR